MAIKLQEMNIANFGKFKDFHIEYGDKITRLVGGNGAGKTTLGITSIWACLKGIAEKSRNGQLIGERYRFIGSEGKAADLELVLVDETQDARITVRNHITAAANKITFKIPDGYKVDRDDWLENLLSVALMSAKNFSQLTPKAQAMALGIDTEKQDKKIQMIKEDYTSLNAIYRGLGDIPEGKKVEKVSITDLVGKKDAIDKANGAKAEARRAIERERESIDRRNLVIRGTSEAIEEAKAAIVEAQKSLEEDAKKRDILIQEFDKAKKAYEETAVPEPDASTEEIVAAITNAETTNAAAAEWEADQEKQKRKLAKKEEMEANRKQLETAIAERLKYVKGALKVEVEGLEVDEEGGLTLGGKLIREPYFSKGELEVAVAKIAVAMNPDLRIRFIDEFQSLDAANQKKIVEDLFAAGFQVITSEVNETKVKKDVIVLKECEQVKKTADKPAEKTE